MTNEITIAYRDKNTIRLGSNCQHYRWKLFGSECKLRANWVIEEAFIECFYERWLPNQKLYDKFKIKKGVTNGG